MKTDIKDQSEEKKRKFLQNKKFYDAPKKSEKSVSEKSQQKSDQSIANWVQLSKDRFDFIMVKINTTKSLATMIDNKRYTLNDANELINKIAKQKIGKNIAIK